MILCGTFLSARSIRNLVICSRGLSVLYRLRVGLRTIDLRLFYLLRYLGYILQYVSKYSSIYPSLYSLYICRTLDLLSLLFVLIVFVPQYVVSIYGPWGCGSRYGRCYRDYGHRVCHTTHGLCYHCSGQTWGQDSFYGGVVSSRVLSQILEEGGL